MFGPLRRYRMIIAIGVVFFLCNLPVLYFTIDTNRNTNSKKAIRPSYTPESPETHDLSHENGDPYPMCKITDPAAQKAMHKAKTVQCRNMLKEFSCRSQLGTLYPTRLERTCPLDDVSKSGSIVGCAIDDVTKRLMRFASFQWREQNSPQFCIDTCIRIGAELAGVQYGYECYCGRLEILETLQNKLIDTKSCEDIECPGEAGVYCGGYKTMMVYHTGIGRLPYQKEPYSWVAPTDPPISPPGVKVLFLLQLTGRGVRQVTRMLKLIHTPNHYYLIHVDSRQKYLYESMKNIVNIMRQRGLNNVALAKNRFTSMWGGASLNTMILSAIREALLLWSDWNCLLNLSESDMPILPILDLEAFLTKYKGKNMLKSHGNNTKTFISKQGMERIFVECEGHMWRIGERTLPLGIRIDGGSDWIVITRKFAHYAANDNNTLAKELRRLFETTLLPAESFYHTLLTNSPFCDTHISTNLKMINWHRRQGCKCQYKRIVDWCGCSPSVFIAPNELGTIHRNVAKMKGHYFARKFDPMIDQTAISRVEQDNLEIIELYMESSAYSTYWYNEYDSNLEGPPAKESYGIFLESLARISLDLHEYKECTVSNVISMHIVKVDKSSKEHIRSDKELKMVVEYQILCGSVIHKVESLYIRNWTSWTSYLYKNKTAHVSLVNAHVGTDFDAKELILRGYFGFVSDISNPSVRHEWTYDSQYDPDSKFNAKKVEISWINPRGNIVRLLDDDLIDPRGDARHVYSIELDPAAPLQPGEWTVKMKLHDVYIAVLHFPVYPSSAAQITQTDIDVLTNKFYTPTDLCSIPSSEKFFAGASKLKKCTETSWSSHFPDPKSQI